MKDLIRKYYKTFAFFSILILTLISFSIVILFKSTFDEVVDLSLQYFLADITHTTSHFTNFGTVEINSVVLKDKKGNIVVSSPKVILKYNMIDILHGKITQIDVKKPYVYIALDKKRAVNIAKIFSNNSSSKSGTRVPIRIITVMDAQVLYQDNYYKYPINKIVDHMDGYVAFDNKNGIDLRFYNRSIKNRVEYSFTNYYKPYSMTIKLKNQKIDENIMQYAYTNEYTNYLGGRVNLDLTVASDGLWGYAEVFDGKFVTSAYNGLATDVGGHIDFLGHKISLSVNGLMDQKKVNFSLKYQPSGLEMDVTASNLKNRQLNKVTLIDKSTKNKIDKLGNFNISYLNLKFKFDKKYKLTLENYIELDPFTIDKIKIDGLKGMLVIKDHSVKFKKVNFFLNYKKNRGIVLLDGQYINNLLNLNFNLINKNSPLKLKKLKGNILYNINSNKIDYTLYSNILKIDGNIRLDQNIFEISSIGTEDVVIKYKNNNYSTKNKIKVIYNYRDKKLILGKGKINIRKKRSSDSFSFSFNNNGNNIIFKNIALFFNEFKLTGKGNLDTTDLSYKFDYDGHNLSIEDIIPVKQLKTHLNLTGTLLGVKNRYKIISDIKNSNGDYKLSYNNLSGRLIVDNTNNLYVDFNGYVKKILYKQNELNDFKISLNYKNKKLKVLEFRNNFLTIAGDYNIINKTFAFNYKIMDFNGDKIKILNKHNIKIHLKNAIGKLYGTVDNINLFFDSKQSRLQYKNLPNIPLKGAVQLNKQNIIFKNFKIDQNNVNGFYDLSHNKFRLTMNLLEDNLPQYYEGKNLKYRLIGEIIFWGVPQKIDAIAQIYADNVYLRGSKLPNIKVVSTLKGGDLNKIAKTGHVDINKITLYTDKHNQIIKGKGWIDLFTKKLSLKINDTLDANSIKNYLPLNSFTGKLNAKIDVDGNFSNLKYNLNLGSKSLSINKNNFNDIKLKLNGDFKNIKLEKLSASYHKNKIYSYGQLNLKNFDYKLYIKSNQINLDFLNIFSSSKQINKIRGIANIDIMINSKNNYGQISIKDFSANMPKYNIKIDKINSYVSLNKKTIKIENFNGNINNGSINMSGYLNIPNISKNQLKKGDTSNLYSLFKLKQLDYKLDLKLDHVDLSYQKAINLVLSSEFEFSKNRLVGNFTVNSGEILANPKIKNENIANLASEIKKKETMKNIENLGSKLNIQALKKESSSFDNIDFDINLKTENPIKLKIPKVDSTSIIRDIYGDLIMDGNLTLTDKKLSYGGNISIQHGTLVVNNNMFYLDTASVKFIKLGKQETTFHPLVLVNARSKIANEDVYININGEYPNLQIQMSSGSGLTLDDIGSLLAFQNLNKEKSGNTVLKNVLDREISSRIFSPISSEIANLLKIEKFQISSNLVAGGYENGVYRYRNSLGLGASIYAENPIYKDILYWQAKAKWGTSVYYGSVTSYDFNLANIITKNLSWGLGVGKIPEGRAKANSSLFNYHVDLRWKKKYDSLKDIIISLF